MKDKLKNYVNFILNQRYCKYMPKNESGIVLKTGYHSLLTYVCICMHMYVYVHTYIILEKKIHLYNIILNFF